MRLVMFVLISSVVFACGNDGAPSVGDDMPQDASPPDASPPDADVPTGPLDQLVEVPLATTVIVADGCETWPPNPERDGAGSTLLRIGDAVLWATGSAMWRLDGARWTREIEFDDTTFAFHLRAFGDQVMVATDAGTYLRASDGTWSLQGGIAATWTGMFRVRDDVYAWRFHEQHQHRHVYRWNATAGTWAFVFATQYAVVSMTGSDDGLFVTTNYHGVLRWDGAQLVPFPSPTTTSKWEVLGDGNGRLFALSPTEHVHRLEGDTWVDEGFDGGPIVAARVQAGVLVLGQRARLDSGWVTVADETVGVSTVYPDGSAFGVRSGPAGRVPVMLSGGTWTELPYASGIESGAISVIDRDHAFAVDRGTLLHLSGAAWSRVILPWDVWASDVLAIDGELFVVSTAGGGDLILHWDGAVWTLEPLDDRDAVQIVGRSADEVFVVASCHTHHWDGSRWRRFRSHGCPGEVTDRIAFVGEREVAAFERNGYLDEDRVQVIDVPTGEFLDQAVFAEGAVFGELRGASRQAVVLTADDMLTSYDSSTGWTTPVALPDLGAVKAVGGAGVDDAIFVQSDRLLHWDGNTVETLATPGRIGTQVFTDGTDVLVGGDYRLVTRCATPW